MKSKSFKIKSIHTFVQSIEKNNRILDFKIKNVPIWLILRQQYFNSLERDILVESLDKTQNLWEGNDKSNVLIPRSKKNFLKKIFEFLISILHVPFFSRNKKVLFYATSIKKVEGIYRNIFIDIFQKNISHESFILFESSESYKSGLNNHIKSSYFFEVISFIISKLIRLKKNEKKVLNQFKEHIKHVEKTNDLQKKSIITNFNIEKEIKLFLAKKFIYFYLLKFLKPEFIIGEDLSYTRFFITLNAKKLNIKTAEIQHGSLDKNNVAYNLGEGLKKYKSIQKYYPDFFLSFGEYWINRYNIPSEHINLGFPFLEKNRFLLKQNVNKSILIVSNSINPKEISKYTLKLNKISKNKGYKIFLRPRPSEKKEISFRYSSIMKIDNIVFDFNENLYESISSHEIIVGDYSTVLFEALFFDKKVFLFDTIATKMYSKDQILPLISYDNVDKIFDYNISFFENYKKKIWTENSLTNFTNFLKV